MADQKGSSSNPAKGLVTHLDRNRNLQQDRTVASHSSPASSFRSQNHNAPSAEANFTNFTAPNTQFGALPLRPAQRHPQPQPFQASPGIGWHNEYFNGQLGNPGSLAADQRRANHTIPNQEAVDPVAAYRNAAPANSIERLHNFAHTPVPAFQPHLGISHPGPYQEGPARAFFQHGDGEGIHMQRPAGVAGVAPEQYNIYPEQVLADNPGEAMEAAFAAYDQDFSQEMDSWMARHGPAERVDHVPDPEEVLGDVLPGNYDGQDMPQTKEDPQGDNKVQEDLEMKKHASQILGTLSAEGSAETKEKFKTSSFVGLMKAIATGQAIVQGDTFVDPSGKPIEDLAALADGQLTTLNNNGDGNGEVEGKSDSKGKGKGKMKSLDELTK